MFSVQLLARFFSNSDKLIVPAQQTLLRVDFVDTVQLAVVELIGLVGLVRGWVDAVGLVDVELVGLVDLVVNLVRL